MLQYYMEHISPAALRINMSTLLQQHSKAIELMRHICRVLIMKLYLAYGQDGCIALEQCYLINHALTDAISLLQLNAATSLLLYKPTHDSWVDPMKVHGAADLSISTLFVD